jgi:hypothetical protein
MATKIYIAGKITGDPNYKAKFAEAENFYKKKGYTVLTPTWMPQGMRPADYMRICFAMIDTADVVAFLPGFRQSAGASLELSYCFYTEKAVHLPEREPEIQQGMADIWILDLIRQRETLSAAEKDSIQRAIERTKREVDI